MTQTFIQTFILLILVTDPFGNVPLFVSALAQVPKERRWKVVVRECLIAFAVLLIFMFFGRHLLAAMQLSQISLRIGGSVILFLIALRMVFPQPGGPFGVSEEGGAEPFIVPLAIPYVAGPSLLATELLFMSREPTRWKDWLVALTAAWLATAMILMLASRLRSFLSQKGLVAIERLMGMILVAIAVQMFLSGIEHWQSVRP